MNPAFFMRTMASFKNEAIVVFGVLGLILALPIIGVIVLFDTGIPVVSNALASADPVTHAIEVHDPVGKVVAKVDATTVWPVVGVDYFSGHEGHYGRSNFAVGARDINSCMERLIRQVGLTKF